MSEAEAEMWEEYRINRAQFSAGDDLESPEARHRQLRQEAESFGPGLNDGPKGLRPGGGILGCRVLPGVEKNCLGAPGETEKFGRELPDMSWHEANVPMKTKVLNVQLHWDSIGKAGAPTQSPTRSGAPGSFKSWVGAPTPFPIFPGHPQDLRELLAHFKNCAGAPAQSPGMAGAPSPLQELPPNPQEWRELPAHFTYQLGAPVICQNQKKKEKKRALSQNRQYGPRALGKLYNFGFDHIFRHESLISFFGHYTFAGNYSVFPFLWSEFKHFGWSNSLGRMEFTIEYDVKHTQKDYTSVRGRIDSQEEKEHVWILVHHAIIASLPGHASIWHVKNPIIEQSLCLICSDCKVQNGGEEFKKSSTALPNVWIPELCQYMGLKLQNVT
ncbi:hypothetical protein C8J57DRAFT_1244223 [Mycena rebaudengoi]|nr:hypothetical protein C8J57DRAFT_1244223 [Mycena rebaudengoi]